MKNVTADRISTEVIRSGRHDELVKMIRDKAERLIKRPDDTCHIIDLANVLPMKPSVRKDSVIHALKVVELIVNGYKDPVDVVINPSGYMKLELYQAFLYTQSSLRLARDSYTETLSLRKTDFEYTLDEIRLLSILNHIMRTLMELSNQGHLDKEDIMGLLDRFRIPDGWHKLGEEQ